MQNILKLLSNLLRQIGCGLSNAAPAVNTPVGTIAPNSTTTILKIERKTLTTDGVFGVMTVNGIQVCESCENLGEEIPEGLYDAKLDKSPRLGYVCPHIAVSMRDMAAGGDAGIRIHIFNEPQQSKGCIGVGLRVSGDSVEESKNAFEKLMKLLPPTFKVLVYSVH